MAEITDVIKITTNFTIKSGEYECKFKIDDGDIELFEDNTRIDLTNDFIFDILNVSDEKFNALIDILITLRTSKNELP